MKQINYNVVLQGRSTAPDLAASKDGSHSSVNVTAAAVHDQIRYLEGAQHVALVLQSSVRNALSFEARITMDVDGVLQQTGRVRFGDGEHALAVSTAGQGRLAPSPDQRAGRARRPSRSMVVAGCSPGPPG
jgi:hypothetical protein